MDITIAIDENAKDVLITLIQVGGALLTGVLIAWIGFRYGRKLEAERWQREDERRTADRELERAERWLDRRRELYATLMAEATELTSGVFNPPEGSDGVFDVATKNRMVRAHHEIILISPHLRRQSGELVAMGTTAENAHKVGLSQEVIDAFFAALKDFEAAARADLER